MITFLDGPAKEQVLMLKRGPIMLRVVESPKGFDALDQPGDVAAANEKIHVYIMIGKAGSVHVCRRQSAGGSGWFIIGEYPYLPEQPRDEDVRRNDRWASWCVENLPRLMEFKAATEARRPPQ